MRALTFWDGSLNMENPEDTPAEELIKSSSPARSSASTTSHPFFVASLLAHLLADREDLGLPASPGRMGLGV